MILAVPPIQRDPRGQGFPPWPRGPLSSRGSAPGFPIPGELPPSPERPASGSLRPSAVSARTRSSGSPTLASPPVRRQPLCNPTTLNTHPPTAWETSANSTPARRCCPCCAWCACCIAHILLLLSALLTRLCLASAPEYDVARGAGLSLPAHGPSSSRGSAPGFPIPGELPPSPERPASGSLRPSAVSARTRSSGSPTLASPPVRRQPLCNPTTLNTHPRTTCETPAKRSGRYDVGHTRTAIPPVASPGTTPELHRARGMDRTYA